MIRPAAVRPLAVICISNHKLSPRICRRHYSAHLAEVGRFEDPKLQDKYEPGQMFLHRTFGYRGVILFPWVGKVHERNVNTKPSVEDGADPEYRSGDLYNLPKDSTVSANPYPHTYYQTLIDSRDRPYINFGSESVSFLSTEEGGAHPPGIYDVRGVDYVSHDDVLPYQSTEKKVIHNTLFDRFLELDAGSERFVAKANLKEWQQKNQHWLELTDVYREVSNDFRITVMPFFLGIRSEPRQKIHSWRYLIRIEYLGEDTVQLKERHWQIFDSIQADFKQISGRGVVGLEPVFSPKQRAFQYSSVVLLEEASGFMWGRYKMEAKDGTSFEISIPKFALNSK